MTEYRRDFDDALSKLDAGDYGAALRGFVAVTEADSSVSDAWLGRIAAGDVAVSTLAAARNNMDYLYRETRRLEREDGELSGRLECPKYLVMPVNSPAMVALAHASALITARQFPKAGSVLDDPALSAAVTAQWQQFLKTCLFYMAELWPDVLTVAATKLSLRPHEIHPDLQCAIDAMAGVAAVRMGRDERCLELLDAKKIARTTNPYIRADAALARGWALRALERPEEARAQFEQALINGALLPAAQGALDDDSQRLPVITEAMIAARTDRWDPGTQPTADDLAAEATEDERQKAGQEWRRVVDNMIGHDEVKEQIEVWRTEIEIEQVTAELEGRPPEDLGTGNIIFEGPPGTGKTTWGRVITDILFELGLIRRRHMVEVTEEDLVKGWVSQTPEFTKQKLMDALGGVFFLDEAPRLVPKTEGHSFGPQAIDTINKFMTDHAGDIVVIVAGYADEMPGFLKVNQGFGSRFRLTFTFNGYGPAQVREIAQKMTQTRFKTPLVVQDDAWPLLESEAARLRHLRAFGNGRYAEQVIDLCRSERARRMQGLSRDELRQLATDGGLAVIADDMGRALEQAGRRYTSAQPGDSGVVDAELVARFNRATQAAGLTAAAQLDAFMAWSLGERAAAPLRVIDTAAGPSAPL